MVLPSVGDDRRYNVTVPLDEPSIEICESQESADLMEVLRGAPLGNGFDLPRVHGYAVLGDNQTQIGNLLLVELAVVCSESKLFEY